MIRCLCGKTGRIYIDFSNPLNCKVYCTGCDAQTEPCPTAGDAELAWNNMQKRMREIHTALTADKPAPAQVLVRISRLRLGLAKALVDFHNYNVPAPNLTKYVEQEDTHLKYVEKIVEEQGI